MRNATHTRQMKKKREGGFSLVEIVVATAIISLTLVSVVVVASQSIVLSRRALNTYSAAALLEEGAEAVRIVRDNGWTNISSLSNGTLYYPQFSGGTWSLSANSSTVGIFTRTVSFGAVTRDAGDDIAASGTADSGTRLVTVTVAWPEGGTTVSKSIQLYVSDIF